MAKVVPPGAPAPQSALGWDGTDFYVIRTDATGHAQIDVLTSALPAGAATAAHQVTQTTALQLIDDLRGALQSVATDRLQVRGEDQLFTFKGVLALRSYGPVSRAGGDRDSAAVPAGEIWVVTSVVAGDTTTATTRQYIMNRHNGADVNIHDEIRAFTTSERIRWSGHTYLDVGDVIRVGFIGSLAGDNCVVDITGYRMTTEV